MTPESMRVKMWREQNKEKRSAYLKLYYAKKQAESIGQGKEVEAETSGSCQGIQ